MVSLPPRDRDRPHSPWPLTAAVTMTVTLTPVMTVTVTVIVTMTVTVTLLVTTCHAGGVEVDSHGLGGFNHRRRCETEIRSPEAKPLNPEP